MLTLSGLDPTEGATAIDSWPGEEMPYYRILSRIREQPIFGGRRILWITRADQSTELDPADLLEKNNKTVTTVVLEGPEKTLSSWTRSLFVYSLALPLKPADREAWIHFLGHRHGLTLDKSAISPIMTTFEGSLGPIDRLFHEIAAKKIMGPITARTLGDHGIDDHYKSVFDLIRGLEQGDKDFFREWKRFLETGQSPFGLISLLHRQWRLYRIARIALDGNDRQGNAESAVSTLGGVSSFVAGGVVRFARKMPLRSLQKGTEALWEADLLLKSGVSSTLVMDQLAATLFFLSNPIGVERQGKSQPGPRKVFPRG